MSGSVESVRWNACEQTRLRFKRDVMQQLAIVTWSVIQQL